MRRSVLLLAHLLVLIGCGSAEEIASEVSIDIWYGDLQSFGHLGNPQKYINILGNVSSSIEIAELQYSLNGDEAKGLSMGPDLHRLASSGDFNIDLKVQSLKAGTNLVSITATDVEGNKKTHVVTVKYVPGQSWALPYSVDWRQVGHIQDVVQVVDGKWKLTEDGIRTVEPYYDRVIAFGDLRWKDYEVTTSVVFHDFTPPEEGPPTYNVSHAAIATRWPGHDEDEHQPCRKWFPLGATAEFRLTGGLDECRWRVFDGEELYVEDLDHPRGIELDIKYLMKHRVQTLSDGRTRYQVKLWQASLSEPNTWDLEAIEPAGNLPSGSALLIAHHTDVTFGNIQVIQN
jgi:hypothetical protein